jgi:signal transduction histidine kinase
VLGLSVIVAIAVAGFSLAHSESLERKTVRQYEEVERARTELQQFAARLMQIQEEERTRLSRDLHDEIGQALATLRLEVARAETVTPEDLPEVRERLIRARQLAERTVQTIRDISTLLRPSLLDDLGLQPALEWQVEDFTRRTGVQCELLQHGPRESLPEPVRTCVYRVIQESLHNCEKHSAAKQVTVSIAQAESDITVTVQDDGSGFSTEAEGVARRSGRFGILGMRERATALGGDLEVASAAGAGVRVVLRLPLPAAPAKGTSLNQLEASA